MPLFSKHYENGRQTRTRTQTTTGVRSHKLQRWTSRGMTWKRKSLVDVVLDVREDAEFAPQVIETGFTIKTIPTSLKGNHSSTRNSDANRSPSSMQTSKLTSFFDTDVINTRGGHRRRKHTRHEFLTVQVCQARRSHSKHGPPCRQQLHHSHLVS